MPDQESGRRSKIRNTTRATLAGVAVAVGSGSGSGRVHPRGGAESNRRAKRRNGNEAVHWVKKIGIVDQGLYLAVRSQKPQTGPR
jgi:hypothetical protein